jgi:hypothetical protein
MLVMPLLAVLLYGGIRLGAHLGHQRLVLLCGNATTGTRNGFGLHMAMFTLLPEQSLDGRERDLELLHDFTARHACLQCVEHPLA